MNDHIHTIIFDLDGTLSDSSVLTMAALTRLAPRFGLSIPPEDAVRRATGHANPEFYLLLFPDAPRDRVLQMGEEVEQEELRILPTVRDRLLFEGCRELLVRLKTCGMHLHIASTGDRRHVFSILKETEIAGFFDSVACGRPDKTEMLSEIIAGGDKADYAMVGDMKKDHTAARANGILSVGACYGYCLRAHTDFDLYIDTPLDLLRVLNIQGG